MPVSRRSMLTAASAGLASAQIAGAPAAEAAPVTSKTVAELVALSEVSNAVLMRGDIDTYRRLITLSDDFTLMAPFGGKPSRRADYTDERMEAMGRFFRNGTLSQELVAAYRSPDMVVLATIERSHVEVGGLPAQDWALRVTLVYRREGAGWKLAHRHADPLAPGISLQEAAALSRRKP